MKLFYQLLQCPKTLRIHSLHVDTDTHEFTLQLVSFHRRASCPECGKASRRIHSRYTRTIADLPWAEWPVRLHLTVRKFFCLSTTCKRIIFCERFGSFVAPWGRKTRRLCEGLRHLASVAGASAGARLGRVLGRRASRNTLLRLIRASPEQPRPTSRVIGVDDWAIRKGNNYGSVLVDLERRKIIELLPDREAETLANWLNAHPHVEVICRDRAEAYAEGARRGAPEARQVADRFHLIRNLFDVLHKVFEGHRKALYAGKSETFELTQVVDPWLNDPRMHQAASHSAASIIMLQDTEPMQTEIGKRRLENYRKARELHHQGWTYLAIGRYLGIRRQTVSRYVQASSFPDRRRASKLDPYKGYILERWNAGCRTGTVLFDEVKALGYIGKRSTMLDYITRLRRAQGLPPRSRVLTPNDALSDRRAGRLSPRRAASLILRRDLKADDQQIIDRMRTNHEDLEEAITLAQAFTRSLRERRSDEFDRWLVRATASTLAPFRRFAKSLQRDYEAVKAAFELPWSTSPVEGHINKLKMVKRQMYGRAKLDLLEKRLLYTPH